MALFLFVIVMATPCKTLVAYFCASYCILDLRVFIPTKCLRFFITSLCEKLVFKVMNEQIINLFSCLNKPLRALTMVWKANRSGSWREAFWRSSRTLSYSFLGLCVGCNEKFSWRLKLWWKTDRSHTRVNNFNRE